MLAFLFSTNVPAQNNNSAEMSITLNISAIALIDFVSEGSQTITFNYSNLGPHQVEQQITPDLGSKTWLNYSSIVNIGSTNYITVHISSGTLPGDASLDVIIGSNEGAGAGINGTTTGRITLSKYPQNIITNIGSCYTGRGIHKGHQLTYIWENPDSYDYSLNYDNGQAIAVTYTITATE